jgi:hypothetical protein
LDWSEGAEGTNQRKVAALHNEAELWRECQACAYNMTAAVVMATQDKPGVWISTLMSEYGAIALMT